MLRRIHKCMPKEIASNQRERENQPQVSKNQKKKKKSPNKQKKLIKTFKIIYIYIYIYCMLNRVLHDAATSHQTNPMVDESMKVEV